ncbi:MAG: response regulator [Phycisphaerae bacterium]|jgi:DNA-binding response OmpR family regulator|nr:response regulator [Phycisphaerae bacterium]
MARRTILIVDGGEDSRLVLENRLAAEGYYIITECTGRDAFMAARAKHPDLIITDRVLADTSGKELASKLRENSRTCTIPVAFWSELLPKQGAANDDGSVTGEEISGHPYGMVELKKAIERLLCASPDKNRKEETPKEIPLSSNTSVLVIDDEPDIRRVLEYNLELDGFKVYAAADGPTGLRIAREKMPDVILLDWVMPKMDGLEVLSELRRDETTKDIIVFMLTAKNMMDDVSTALANGADDYIPKPFNGAELGKRITSMLEVLRRQRGDNAGESEEIVCLSSTELA